MHNINGTTIQKDYCGSAIYEIGTARFWQTEAGYISMDDSKYHYYLQDHQGNNWVVVSETIERNAEYYDWSMGCNLSPHKRINNFKKSIKSLFNN